MKPTVTRNFDLPDGSTSPKASMNDAMTFHQRVFGRIRDLMTDDLANRTIMPGHNAYNNGAYDDALKHFREAIVITPRIKAELYPQLAICERVLNVQKDYEDGRYEESMSRWESSFLRRFRKAPYFKLRCKYCGHYTRYIDPDVGLAYFGTNNCDRCDRGYPMPDFIWDSIDGQAYIYYRRSVSEKAFFREFEERFNVEEPLPE